MGRYEFTETIRFSGTFNRSSSAFKGPPSKAVDEAWSRIVPLGAMRIPEEIYRELNASKHAVRVPSKAGGGRMALFEAIHLLHCVKSLWEATYPEYYTSQYQLSLDNPEEWHEHIDHCADMLRQKLMCDADATLITYNWIKDHYAPHPNFNVQHKCRNYDDLIQVAAEHMIDGKLFSNGWILRPTDRSVVEFDEPPFDPNAD
ncbi:hypothetical protein CC78DRAFT_606068 [Lojkania enalia]|uniref:Uncharacterized protein n=1 Tax=Lojkania enalia TaxID=147567 RepID=A0A9P4K9L5_9PLEO|nr:hypothetical protein CC78DRAFT_606068 [Didymosphaeria enalia]